MAPVLSLLIALAMPAMSLAAAIPQDDVDISQIVGGTAAASGEFPYIISLQNSAGSHSCGGALLNANTVITAGHCVEDQVASRLRIRAGTLVSCSCSARGRNEEGKENQRPEADCYVDPRLWGHDS